jgi:5'-AMP-activated protein kinase catalytic alpha subunit
MGITHRDLKPENILLDSSKKNIKVIDFGLSNYCANSELLKSACGSPCFASPEMLSGKSYQGVTTDLWSAGIVLYSMLVGTLPFDDKELNTLYEHIKIGTFYIPSNLSLESIDFLKKILQVDPDKRINIEGIKKHKWFNIEKNIMYKGIDLTVETFSFNEKIIDYVIKIYYKDNKEINRNNFIKMIQYHACNQYTATYYLIEKKIESNKDNKFFNNKQKKDDILNSQGNSIRNNKKEKMISYNLNRNEKLYSYGYNSINENENKNRINNKNENLNHMKKSKNQKNNDKKIIKDNIKQYFKMKINNE